MRQHVVAVILFLFMLFTRCVAQSDGITMFGYFQTTLQSQTDNDRKHTSTSFNLNQLNVFLQNDFSGGFSSFVNFELTNSFSSAKNIGSFKIEEAWVKYHYADWLSARSGAIIPAFNNLNEIKNKSPLLPYILRPIAYESTIDDILSLEDWVPQRAWIQVEGVVPVQGVTIDYAAYAGNSETKFIKDNSSGNNSTSYLIGSDTTTNKLLGGRVGIRYAGVKAGVSFTMDKDYRFSPVVPKGFYNSRDTTLNALGSFPSKDLGALGAVDRTRFGVDLSYVAYGFTIEMEYIKVSHTLTAAQQKDLDATAATIPVVVPTPGGPLTVATIPQPYNNSLDKSFYYAHAGYDITDEWNGYVGYSYIDSKLEKYFADGLAMSTAGFVYKPLNEVAVKGQYQTFKMNNTKYIKVDYTNLLLGVSVFF